jgi:hypothetical protein
MAFKLTYHTGDRCEPSLRGHDRSCFAELWAMSPAFEQIVELRGASLSASVINYV